jgi:cholesterol transport system auxiliary component
MTAWRSAMIRTLASALAVALISGCTLLSPADSASSKAMLNKLPPAQAQRETHAATLLLLPVEAKPVYDTTQMAYMTQPYQIDYYTRHEWAATPAQMLQPLLVQTLERTRYFHAVLTPPYSGSCSYVLRTQILELVQDYTAAPATLHLALRLQLSDGASDRVIATREISLREPMAQQTPDAGVAAANEAAARALQEASEFVLEHAQ